MGDKIEIEGEVTFDADKQQWCFESDDSLYSFVIPAAIDEIMETDSEIGERYKITVERLSNE